MNIHINTLYQFHYVTNAHVVEGLWLYAIPFFFFFLHFVQKKCDLLIEINKDPPAVVL